MFDFDKVNQRRGTGCVKWDNDRDGVIPMWVADMNFETVPTIPKAIMDRAAHPAYGYFAPREEYFQSIID